MSLLNLDFLVGCLCGSFVIPALVRRMSTGRWDGWIEARRQKPALGSTVLACLPWTSVHAVTYNGPDGGGEIPEDAPALLASNATAPSLPGTLGACPAP